MRTTGFGSLSSLLKNITAVDDEMYNDMSAHVRESEKKSLRKVSVSFA